MNTQTAIAGAQNSNLGEIRFEVTWEPLQSVIPQCQWTDWMYIGSRELNDGTMIHLYKHAMTRAYLNLSHDGRTWKYSAAIDGYVEIPREEAMARVSPQ